MAASQTPRTIRKRAFHRLQAFLLLSCMPGSLLAVTPSLADFNGDGKTDVLLFRERLPPAAAEPTGPRRYEVEGMTKHAQLYRLSVAVENVLKGVAPAGNADIYFFCPPDLTKGRRCSG